jgi:hypothetical protein
VSSTWGRHSAGRSIHANARPGFRQYLMQGPPAHKEIFDRTKHTRRIVILVVAKDAQRFLVPSTSRKGGLVVAIAPHLLPGVLRPTRGNAISASLFSAGGIYEHASFGESSYLPAWLDPERLFYSGRVLSVPRTNLLTMMTGPRVRAIKARLVYCYLGIYGALFSMHHTALYVCH